MNDLVLKKGKKIFTNTKIIANSFNKEHNKVVKIVEKILLNDDTTLANISECKLTTLTGQKIKGYELDEIAHSIVVLSFTDPKYIPIKVEFVRQFAKMKEYIEKQINTNLTDISKITKIDLAKMIIESEEYRIKLEKENKLLEVKIEDDKPKVDAWDDFVNSDTEMTMQLAAGLINDKVNIGRNNLFEFLRSKEILQTGGKKHNIPYRDYIKAGYFTLRENKIMKSEGWAQYKPQTLVTPKGAKFILNLLTKNREIEDTENILKFESKGI